MRLLFLAEDPFSFPKKSKKSKKEGLSDYSRRNFLFQKSLAEAFAGRGDTVLFAFTEPSDRAAPRFSIHTDNDLLCLSLSLTAKTPFAAAEKASFVLLENAAAIAGFFEPDAVISGGFFPISVFAAEKIAEISNAVLISFVAASPKIFGRLPLEKAVLNAAFHRIKQKSAAVFGSYPRFSSDFSQKNARAFRMPPPTPLAVSSEKAEKIRGMMETLREGGTFVLTAVGPFGKDFSTKALLAAVGTFDKKTVLLLSGADAEKPALERFIRENGLTNIFFGEGVPPEELSFTLGGSDAVFLSENAKLGGFFTESDRFLSAFSSERPVLAAVSENAGLLREGRNAVFTVPDDGEGLRKGLETLRNFSDEHRAHLGEQGKNFARRHDFSAFFEEFSSLLLQLSNNQKENSDL